MPTLPSNTKCASLGCKENRSRLSTFCIGHGGKDTYKAKATQDRRQVNAMYDAAAWKRIRAAQLSREPLCAGCATQGRIVQAVQVDHLFSWNDIGKEAFYDNIFQSLCTSCHSHKTSLEHQGIYRHYTGGKAIDYALTQWRTATSAQTKSVPTPA